MSKPVAVITGGASGIGNACAKAFCETHTIVIADMKNAEKAAQNLPHPGFGMTVDVTNYEECHQLAQKSAELGQVSILIHCAGIISKGAYIGDMEVEDWNRTMNINLTGTFYITKAFFTVLQDGASVILMGSRSGRTGISARELLESSKADYGTSKAGVISFVRNLAFELAPRKIRVNGIAPGPILTPLIGAGRPEEEVKRTIPLGRQGTPADVVPAIQFLCSEGASWITGHTIDINGGMYM